MQESLSHFKLYFHCCAVSWPAIYPVLPTSTAKIPQDIKMLLSTILVLLSRGLAAAASSPCTNVPYTELLFLSAYPPAESYRSEHYPLPTKTVTTTFTAPARRLRQVPEPEPTPAPLARLVGVAWSSLVAKGGSIVSTLCSCIEKQQTVTTTVGFLVQKPICFDSTHFVPVHRVPCHDNGIS
jgi:hypothetical protein